jgi:hypothetical protein
LSFLAVSPSWYVGFESGDRTNQQSHHELLREPAKSGERAWGQLSVVSCPSKAAPLNPSVRRLRRTKSIVLCRLSVVSGPSIAAMPNPSTRRLRRTKPITERRQLQARRTKPIAHGIPTRDSRRKAEAGRMKWTGDSRERSQRVPPLLTQRNSTKRSHCANPLDRTRVLQTLSDDAELLRNEANGRSGGSH